MFCCSKCEEVRVPERSSVRVISIMHKHLLSLWNCLEGSDGQAAQTKPRVLESDEHGVRLEAVVDLGTEWSTLIGPGPSRLCSDWFVGIMMLLRPFRSFGTNCPSGFLVP